MDDYIPDSLYEALGVIKDWHKPLFFSIEPTFDATPAEPEPQRRRLRLTPLATFPAPLREVALRQARVESRKDTKGLTRELPALPMV